jgi:hypothetical protein
MIASGVGSLNRGEEYLGGREGREEEDEWQSLPHMASACGVGAFQQ